MGLSDTTVEAGSDKKHHHKRHHSKHLSKHKHSHQGNGSSSDHTSKHKHRYHKHHHHKHHSHKKHHRHKSKVALDEAAIQSALEILEADALEAVKDQVTTELNPETVELMLAACTSESVSEDSSSSSESEGEEERAMATAETATLRIQEVLRSTCNTQQQSPLSDSVPSYQRADSATTLVKEPSALVSCRDVIGTVSTVQEERRSSSKLESDSESDSEDESETVAAFGAPKPASERSNSKTIQIKIHRTRLPCKEKENYNSSVLSSPQDLKSKESTGRESESLNNNGETRTITTGSSKITYVNLKAKKLDSDSRKAGRGSDREKRKAAASEDERPQSSSPEGRRQKRERRNRSSKRRSSRHRRSSSVSGSRSRSRQRSRSWSPHAGRRRHRSHNYQSRSPSRSRSRSPHSRRRSSRNRHSRSRSRLRRDRRSRSRSYTRHRSKSRSRSRSHSLTRRRHSRRRYSRSSSSRRSPRRRRSYHHRSRSRSPYRSRRQRHSSRSRSRSRRSRSHSHSYSRSQSHSSSQGGTRDRAKPASEASVVMAISTAAAAIEATVADFNDPKKAHIAQLTAFCQELQEKQAREGEEEEDEGGGAEPESEVRAPFELNPTPAYQQGLIFHNNAWKTANQIAAEMDAHINEKPVEEKFPVSSGLPHKSTTGGIPNILSASESVSAFTGLQPVSVGDLVVKRLEATRKIQQNPADYEAHLTLAQIEQQTKQWAQSKMKPGRFTGQASLTAISMKEHNTGLQAWAKKDMFLHLAPVMGGFGMKMLKKMGWQEGQPLGKMGEGHVEPIAVQVKVNRSGLSTVTDKQPPVIPASSLQSVNARGAHLVQGKHPVSALQEICAKKKWDPPHYEMVDVAGPAHMKTFLFRVTVPLGTFQPAVASNNKKVAKAQAALAALQGLGLSSGSVEYSAS